eukprot:749745-Hanusia_phi.AAC.2
MAGGRALGLTGLLKAYKGVVECRICKESTKFIDDKIFEDPKIQQKVAVLSGAQEVSRVQVATRLEKVCQKIPDASTEIIEKCQ